MSQHLNLDRSQRECGGEASRRLLGPEGWLEPGVTCAKPDLKTEVHHLLKNHSAAEVVKAVMQEAAHRIEDAERQQKRATEDYNGAILQAMNNKPQNRGC
ncbi:hypothetical protein SAMN05216359_105287 [Roseateles sp. YR242]|uniref:hypothetical protein n=1 Tax=Roseateles sp. YR242 TaxID=1855305 RepID=UPI0008BB3308|nr:hypothetical protein [Roseateles sp. YR242]SEL12562.1 hypothetical protein SAMN05216359_105287 [Roseateles sp. YR242]